MSRLRLLVSDSHDPLFNLAVEECIFRQMDPGQRVLFLWRNANTVVIGRAQNPWKECNTRRMEEDGVTLARRSSGGGAVFHDLGNSCFTFMAGKPEYDKSVSTAIVLDGLKRLGIEAFASGRNDLLVATPDGERKVSGSAYRETLDRGFHHGTLLLDADLGRLANYLNPDPKKLAAKGITSVRSRVANLCELLPGIDHQQVSEALVEAFFHHYGARVEPEHISPEQMPDLPRPSPVSAVGSGTMVMPRRSAICWRSGSAGAGWSCTLMWRRGSSPGHSSLAILWSRPRLICWRPNWRVAAIDRRRFPRACSPGWRPSRSSRASWRSLPSGC